MKALGTGGKLAFRYSPGAAKLGCFLFLLLMIAVGYVGFKIGRAYWDYFEVRYKIQEAVNWSLASPKSERDIIQRIIANTRDLDIELSERNIQVTQSAEHISVTAAWEQEVRFPYYILPLTFKVSLSDEKRWKGKSPAR